jgi:error-prone DNA polymerase
LARAWSQSKEYCKEEKGVIHVIAQRLSDLTPELFESMTTAESAAPPSGTAAKTAVTYWRHPRNTRVLPKGRNFQ